MTKTRQKSLYVRYTDASSPNRLTRWCEQIARYSRRRGHYVTRREWIAPAADFALRLAILRRKGWQVEQDLSEEAGAALSAAMAKVTKNVGEDASAGGL